jgi:glycosyltransferase involved in cell wall biosynthesis
MRVALFTDNDFDKVNGVTTTLKAVLRHAPRNWQPRIYTASEVTRQTDTYFGPASLGCPIPWYSDMRMHLPRLRLFARELRRDGTDLIHITTPGPVGLAGRWLAHRLRLPIVASYHTHLGEYVETFSGSPRLGALMNHYTRWVYGGSDTVLVPSKATRTMLIAEGYRPEVLRVWPRGVDAEQFSPSRASRNMRQRWQVDERRLAILYAGRLSEEKGLHLIAPIQRELYRRGIEHRFIFVGDGPMARELREACPDAMFLGSVPHGQVAVAMASADLFLFPSATDAFGNVVLEAQASGLPVLVSNAGGPQEQVVNGQTGMVCTAGEFASFVDAIVALRHPIARRSMSVTARQFAMGRDWPDALRPLIGAWRESLVSRARDAQPFSVPGDRVAVP